MTATLRLEKSDPNAVTRNWWEYKRMSILGTFVNESTKSYRTIWLVLNLKDTEGAIVRKCWIKLNDVGSMEKHRIDSPLAFDEEVASFDLARIKLVP